MRKRFGILAAIIVCIIGVLIIAFMPIATHSVSIDLPADSGSPRVNPDMNKIGITSDDRILWNGDVVTLAELEANLRESITLPVEPQLQFVPEPSASYELSAKVLGIIKATNVTKFGFVGNEKYTVQGPQRESVDESASPKLSY
jgi:biopolymer transport protein ExbD